MKTVGRRRVESTSWQELLHDVARLQRTLNQVRGIGLVERGVHRFTSFEEAETWMMRQMVRSAALRSSTTSSPSAAR